MLGGITVVLYGMIGLLGAKIWKENGVDFGNPINLVPIAAGIIIGIGNVKVDLTEDFSLEGIALGTIVTIVGYHLARAIAPKELRDRADGAGGTTMAVGEQGLRRQRRRRRPLPGGLSGRSGAARDPVQAPPQPTPQPTAQVRAAAHQSGRNEALVELRTRVHEELIHDLDADQLGGDTGPLSPARRAVEQAADERLDLMDPTLGRQDRLRLASEIADEVLGLGPLEPLLRNQTITEIMVNAYDRVFFERNGIISRSRDDVTRDDAHVLNIIDKILRPVSRRLRRFVAGMVDARLPRWLARECGCAAAGSARTGADDPQVLARIAHLRRPGALGHNAPAPRSTSSRHACACAPTSSSSSGTATGKTTLLNLLSAVHPDADNNGFIRPRPSYR